MGFLQVMLSESLLHLRRSPAGQPFPVLVCNSLGHQMGLKELFYSSLGIRPGLLKHSLTLSFSQLLINSISVCGLKQGHILSQQFSNLSVQHRTLQGLLKHRLLTEKASVGTDNLHLTSFQVTLML